MKVENKWLTAFVCDALLFEFNRVPNGLKGSGNSFVRSITKILRPIRKLPDSFVDDVAVHSHQWKEHIYYFDNFLRTLKEAGVTLNVKKYKWAQSQVKFCGQVIGSGKRFADKEKITVVKEMNAPKMKTELKQILGFFSYFHQYIENFAGIAKPLTDFIAKQVPANIPWKPIHQHAFDELKRLLSKPTTEPLYVIHFSKPIFSSTPGDSRRLLSYLKLVLMVRS